jgi:Uri superfamily endonuclease
MNRTPGTYALVLRSQVKVCAQIGRWRHLNIRPGYYIYVGSAFGPGGIMARVSRHCREGKSKHWHIDYLREYTKVAVVWFSVAPTRLEHKWADALAKLKGTTSISGFGCSDCNCEAHLFYSEKKPVLADFQRVVGGTVQTWFCDVAG